MKLLSAKSVLCLAAFAIILVGCTSEPPPPADGSVANPDQYGNPHPSEGPHHGDLIELGNEEYHAELLHDDQSVRVYVLDADAQQQVAIEATEIMINTTHEGQPKQFTLFAAPEDNDAPGKSSRFAVQDAELAALIDHGHAAAQVVLTINGKSYRGEIRHDHQDTIHSH